MRKTNFIYRNTLDVFVIWYTLVIIPASFADPLHLFHYSPVIWWATRWRNFNGTIKHHSNCKKGSINQKADSPPTSCHFSKNSWVIKKRYCWATNFWWTDFKFSSLSGKYLLGHFCAKWIWEVIWVFFIPSIAKKPAFEICTKLLQSLKVLAKKSALRSDGARRTSRVLVLTQLISPKPWTPPEKSHSWDSSVPIQLLDKDSMDLILQIIIISRHH